MSESENKEELDITDPPQTEADAPTTGESLKSLMQEETDALLDGIDTTAALETKSSPSDAPSPPKGLEFNTPGPKVVSSASIDSAEPSTDLGAAGEDSSMAEDDTQPTSA